MPRYVGVQQASNLAMSVFEVVANIRDRQAEPCTRLVTDDLLNNPESVSASADQLIRKTGLARLVGKKDATVAL